MVTTQYAPTIRVCGFKLVRICERNSSNEEATGNLQSTSNDYPENSEGVWDKLQKTWSLTGEVGFLHHVINGDNTQRSKESALSEAQSTAGASTDEDDSAQAVTLRLSLDLSDLIPHVAQKLELLTDYDRDAFEIKNVSTRDMLVAVRILPVPSDSGTSTTQVANLLERQSQDPISHLMLGGVTSDCSPDISFHDKPLELAPRDKDCASMQMSSKPASSFFLGELETIAASLTFAHVSQPKTVNAQKQTDASAATLAV